jgi:SAM-dependent methyltransferase
MVRYAQRFIEQPGSKTTFLLRPLATSTGRKAIMSNAQINTLNDRVALHNRNAICHAIRAAVNLGVIDALLEGQMSCEELAARIGADSKALRILMNVLISSELVDKFGDDFALSPVARLIPKTLMDFGDRYWSELERFVRTGVSLANDASHPDSDADFLASSATNEWMYTPAALDAAKVLDIGRSRRGIRILELGCGSGVFGATFIHRDPDSRLVLVDNAAGLALARTTIESVQLDSRVYMIENDYMNLNIDEDPFDLVLAAGIVHRHSTEQCQTLMKTAYQQLKPDGELAVVDIFPGQPGGDVTRAVWELEIGLRTASGRLHDPALFQQALVASGFEDVRFAHLPSPPHIWGLMLASRGQ